MTRVTLICAGPTPWDEEDRLVGAHSLPLAESAQPALARLVAAIDPAPTAVYAPRHNEACEQVARMLAEKFDLKVRDNPDLETLHAGLWEGLRREDLRFRFESAFPQWEEAPHTVTPPEGETVGQAVGRIGGAWQKILRKHCGGHVALAVRPAALQILLGLLRGEPLETLSAHLHNTDAVATIEVDESKP